MFGGRWAMADSLLAQRILDVPVAVVDLETTGFAPAMDRVIEIAIALVRGDEPPRLVLDTLVNIGGQPVGLTEVHGLLERDLAGAPGFRDIADLVMAALANRIVV